MIDPALGDRMDDGAELVELHRLRRRLTAKFVDDVETRLLEPFDQRLPLVVFECDVVLGDFEAHQLFTFQERFQTRPIRSSHRRIQTAYRRQTDGSRNRGRELGRLLHGLFRQQKTVHGVNFRVIDVIGGTFEQAFYAAAPAGQPISSGPKSIIVVRPRLRGFPSRSGSSNAIEASHSDSYRLLLAAGDHAKRRVDDHRLAVLVFHFVPAFGPARSPF